eukprot:5371375-Prymnesium_polylepis.1
MRSSSIRAGTVVRGAPGGKPRSGSSSHSCAAGAGARCVCKEIPKARGFGRTLAARTLRRGQWLVEAPPGGRLPASAAL